MSKGAADRVDRLLEIGTKALEENDDVDAAILCLMEVFKVWEIIPAIKEHQHD